MVKFELPDMILHQSLPEKIIILVCFYGHDTKQKLLVGEKAQNKMIHSLVWFKISHFRHLTPF